MSSSKRKAGDQAVAVEADLADLVAPEATSSTPPDPATIAADLLLARAVRECGITAEIAGQDGTIVIVTVPDLAWTPLGADAWKRTVRRGAEPDNGFRDRYWASADWVVWAPEEPPQKFAMGDAADILAKALADGRHCAAFTSDLSWLPRDLVLGSDYRLTLPLLAGDDVRRIAQLVCGGDATESFPGEQAAALTPRLLRLARRPGQSADAYIHKLIQLLQQDHNEASSAAAIKAAPASIREEPTLARMNGMTEAVQWGLNLAKDIGLYREDKISWMDVDRGLLVSGSPGTGKTLFARALANTCGVPLVSGGYGEWHGTGNSHQGDLLKAMRLTFKKARNSAPVILFIDEIDSFPNRATITHAWADWEIQVVNALLAEIDGVHGLDGVVILAACNHPHLLDPALVRSGRLDRHIRFHLPDREALESILREHLGDDLADRDLGSSALAAAGASGADCERFVRGARRRARNAGRAMTRDDLLGEIGGEDDRSPAVLRVAAVHEAGHTVALCELTPGTLKAISLRPIGDSGGRTVAASPSRHLYVSDIRQAMVVLLAGRAAEEIVLGQPSAGAGGSANSDLATATGLATTAAAAFGLDPVIGLIWQGLPEPRTLPMTLRKSPALAARVSVVLGEAYADALALIRRRSTAVEAIAEALLEKQVLDGAEAAAIVARHPAHDGMTSP